MIVVSSPLASGRMVHTAIGQGDVEPTLHAYQAEHGLECFAVFWYWCSRLIMLYWLACLVFLEG